MYVTDIEITDLRCFEGTQSISLDRGDGTYAGWTVFAGRNGSGKSTLLKAIALSCVGPLVARSLVGVFSGWVRQGNERGTIATRLDFDERDRFFSSGATPTHAIWTGLEWRSQSQAPDVLNEWLAKDPNRSLAPKRGPWSERPVGWFVAGYGPYRHLGPMTAEVLRLSQDPVLSRLLNLFHEAATLSDSIDWLRDIHARALEGKPGMEQLRDDVLRLLADQLLPDAGLVERVDSDGLWIQRDGVSLPLERVSDGYRTVTELVVEIVRRLHGAFGELSLERSPEGHVVCKLPGVVLIDEVDAHMHVSWQQKIGFWLTSRFPNIQFLVTTHSPFICQAASAKGIIRLPAPGEDRTIEHVSDELFKAIVNGSADDAVMSELFGLDHPHSDRAEALRRRVAKLESRVLRGLATDQEKLQYAELKAELPDNLGELAHQRLRALYQG
ncbi:AAA family ATPase [Nannocystaceae bacterium ST9]